MYNTSSTNVLKPFITPKCAVKPNVSEYISIENEGNWGTGIGHISFKFTRCSSLIFRYFKHHVRQ